MVHTVDVGAGAPAPEAPDAPDVPVAFELTYTLEQLRAKVRRAAGWRALCALGGKDTCSTQLRRAPNAAGRRWRRGLRAVGAACHALPGAPCPVGAACRALRR